MTVGPLEGLTSGIGDELTELAGLRSTRLTSALLPERSVSTGVNSVDYTQAFTALLGTWTWDGTTTVLATNTTQVSVGDYVRLDADAQDFRIASIDPGVSAVIENPRGKTIPSAATGSSIVDPAVLVLSTGTYAAAVANGHRFKVLRPIISTPALAGTWTWNGTLTVLSTDTSEVLLGDLITLDGDDQYFEIEAIVENVSVTIVNPDGLDVPNGATGSSFLAVEPVEVSALVDTRDNDTTVTLQTGLPRDLSSDSWVIVIDAETTANVESTLDWEAVGIVFIDGIRYTYDSKTLTTLVGLEHFDGVDFVVGAKQTHNPQTEVLDFTQCFAALEIIRKSFLVNFATGDDLSVVGSNIAVPRPPELTDDGIYRELIKAVAYAPRGTIFAMELALTALFGEGNYEIFEDLTLGSINHTCTVFFRRASMREEDPAGKTFLDGDEIRPLDSTTAVTLASAPSSPIRVAGVRLAPEPGPRLIDEGTFVDVKKVSASPPIWEVTDTLAGFSTNIRAGDIVILTTGTFSGGAGTITGVPDGAAPTAAKLTVSALRGSMFTPLDIETNLIGINYSVVRPQSNFRHYRPSEEVYVEYEGDAGTTQWTANAAGGAVELTDVVIADTTTSGRYLQLSDQVTAGTLTYSRPLRCLPSSAVVWEFLVHVPSATLAVGTANLDQITFILRDGAREIAVGFRRGTTTARFEFYDTAGPTMIGTGTGDLLGSTEEWATIRIVKHGSMPVCLYKNEELISIAPYTDFATTSLRELEWGALSTTVPDASLNPAVRIKQMDWRVHEPTDLWNIQVPLGETPGGSERLEDGAANGFFVLGDVGKLVRVKKVSAVDATTGSNALGEWEVIARPSADELDVIGQTYDGAFFDAAFADRMFVRNRPDAFIVPNNLPPHKLEVLTGANADVYTISRFLEITGDPTAALGSLTMSTFPAAILDNEGFTLEDALGNSQFFEWDSETDATPFVQTPGSIVIAYNTFFLDNALTNAERVIDAINDSSLAITASQGGALGSTAWNATNAVVIVEQDTPGTGGNTVIIETVVSGDFAVAGFGGGVDNRDPTKDAAGNDLETLGVVATPDTNPLEERLFAVEIANPPVGGFETSIEEDWRFVPTFPADAGPVEFELVDAGSEAAGVLTFREDLGTAFGMSSGELVAVSRTTVLSAQVLDELDTTTETDPGPPRELSHYAFWLFDDWGFARRVIDKLTVAGVIADFDSLLRDDAGPHIID